MRRAETVDVLVVGLGPAGSRAAQAVAGKGARVVAIDRRRKAGYPVQCAEFVPAQLAHEITGLPRVTRQRIRAMMTFVEDETPDIEPRFPGAIIDREAFDAVLAAQAADVGAQCRFGVGLAALAEDGAAHLTDGTTVRPRAVIGADGPRSRVGRAVGRINSELLETRQATVPLFALHEATDIFLGADIPGGYAWLFPKGAVANLGVGVEPKAKARLRPLLEDLHKELARAGRVGGDVLGLTGGPIPVGGMLRPVAFREGVPVLMAGDAAGLTNPVTGAGIAAAAISGSLAGEAAADWLAGKSAALDGYVEELESLFGAALCRALDRRRELGRRYADGQGPTPADLRRGWIAYSDYWAA